MSRLTIVLWLWKGWRAIYDRRDINAVVTMLRERGELPGNTRILLLTDQQQDWYAVRTKALDVEERPLWADPVPRMGAGRPNCFRRLRLFSVTDQHALGIAADDLVMSMDADSVVCGPVMPLLAPFATRTHNFAAMGGIASRIHGSLFAFRAFSHAHLWTTFHPQLSPILLAQPWKGGPRPIGSDQAWMTRHVNGEHLWHRRDGCYSWNRHGARYSPRYTTDPAYLPEGHAPARYWSFAGHTKPGSEMVKQVRPDLHAIWMDAYGR